MIDNSDTFLRKMTKGRFGTLFFLLGLLCSIPAMAANQSFQDSIEGTYLYQQPCDSYSKVKGYTNQEIYQVDIQSLLLLKEYKNFLVRVNHQTCGAAHIASFLGIGSFDHSNTLVVFPYPDADSFMMNEEYFSACHLIIKEQGQTITVQDTKDQDCLKLFLGGAQTSFTSPGPINKNPSKSN